MWTLSVAVLAGAAFGIGLGLTSNVSGVVLAVYGAVGAVIVAGATAFAREWRRRGGSRP